jgi:2'-deoxynucleoside 5'-phosphate N-hydrolase
MRVYLAAAMTNPARDLDLLARLLAHLEGAGHEVPTRHIAAADGKERDKALTDAELARRDLDWISGSDVLVAEVSTPSHGVGIEVMEALARRLPVLLLRRAGIPVSRLLLGLPGVRIGSYVSVDDASVAIDRFLSDATR